MRISALTTLVLKFGPLFELLALLILLGCFGLLWRFRSVAVSGAVTSALDRRLEPFRRFAQRPVAPILSVGLMAFAGCVVYASIYGPPVASYADEYAYLLAGDTFVHGRLTNAPHAQWPHFEASAILQQPTYQGKYPPGQGLFLALGILLGCSAIGVWVSISVLCAVMTWMLRIWLSPGWGLLGGLAFTAHFGFGSYWAQSYWGGAVAAAGAALAYGGFRLCLTSTGQRTGFGGTALGLGLGLMACSRPFEGLVASLPLAFWFGAWLIRGRAADRPRPSNRAMFQALAGIAVTLPLALGFLGLYNFRVTGNAFLMPHDAYAGTYSKLPSFIAMDLIQGEESGPREFKAANRALVDRHYRPGTWWVGPKEAWSRFAALVMESLGTGLFVAWVCGFWWSVRERWIRMAVVLLCVAFSAHLVVYWYFLHYAAPSVPLLYLLTFAALRVVDSKSRQGAPWGRILVLLIFALQPLVAARSLSIAPEIQDWSVQRHAIEGRFAEQGGRYLLFVSYGRYHISDWEWVYNGADIESRDVVWARDLGEEKNRELMAAFPEHQPRRVLVDDNYRGPSLTESEKPPPASVLPYPR